MPNLNKEISLKTDVAALRRGKYPSKTSMNLAQAENGSMNRVFGAIALIAIIACVLIFAKFFVVDPVYKALSANAKVSSMRAELTTLNSQVEALGEVTDKYAHYIVSDWTDDENALVDREQALALLKSTVMDLGTSRTLSMTGNEAMVVVTGADMTTISNTVATLEASPLIKYVTVSTASDNTSSTKSTTSATLTITFVANTATQAESVSQSSDQAETGVAAGEALGSALGREPIRKCGWCCWAGQLWLEGV